MGDVAGRTILISGATGNLGAAAVAVARGGGARVAALGRSLATLEERFPDARTDASMLLIGGVDLEDARAVESAVAETVSRFGRLDAVLNTVGGFAAKPVAEDDFGTWARLEALNVRTAFNLTRAALAAMRDHDGGGAIIHVGAMAALKAPAGLSAYAASKAAVMRLVEATAEEARPYGITVNAVLPGIIDTPENRAAMPRADTAQWVTPGAIAEAMVLLASSGARAITGALIPVTGRG